MFLRAQRVDDRLLAERNRSKAELADPGSIEFATTHQWCIRCFITVSGDAMQTRAMSSSIASGSAGTAGFRHAPARCMKVPPLQCMLAAMVCTRRCTPTPDKLGWCPRRRHQRDDWWPRRPPRCPGKLFSITQPSGMQVGNLCSPSACSRCAQAMHQSTCRTRLHHRAVCATEPVTSAARPPCALLTSLCIVRRQAIGAVRGGPGSQGAQHRCRVPAGEDVLGRGGAAQCGCGRPPEEAGIHWREGAPRDPAALPADGSHRDATCVWLRRHRAVPDHAGL